MPEWEVGRRGGEREASYDVGHRAREREQAAKETPEQAAAKRVELLWHDADSAVQRAEKLSGIAVRKEWREEREALEAKHRGLKKELDARAVDAAASERARERYTEAAGKVKALGEELAQAKEPRPRPPVRDEVELEPSIIDRRLRPEQLLAWVAGLDKRERQAVEDRLVAIGGSADREDGFAVALSNYFGDLGVRKAYEEWARAAGMKAGPSQPTLRDRFLSVARDPRHWVTLERAPVPKAAGRPGETAPAASSQTSPHETGGSSGGVPSGGAVPAASARPTTTTPNASAVPS